MAEATDREYKDLSYAIEALKNVRWRLQVPETSVYVYSEKNIVVQE